MSSPSELIIKAKNFRPNEVTYQPAKTNARGGKNVYLNYNSNNLHLAIPLMFTWGANERVDESSGRVSYDVSLVFETGKSAAVRDFCKKLQTLQEKVLNDASGEKSREWFGKTMSKEVAEAMMYPILKYPKDKNTGETDYTRNPSMKLKIPYWDGKFNLELYDWDGRPTFIPDKDGDSTRTPQGDKTPVDLIPKKSHIKGLIACTGLWMAGGRFGITWKLLQAKVRNPVVLLGTGKCHVMSDSDDDELIGNSESKPKPTQPPQMSSYLNDDTDDNDDDDDDTKNNVDDNDDDKQEPEPEPDKVKTPVKKKRVIRRKRGKKI
jgi:hypothetical protein